MSERNEEFKALGAEIIAVSRDFPERAGDFFFRRQVMFTCLVDPDRGMYAAYGVPSKAMSLGQRPATFIIDVRGYVAYADVGRQQWDIPDVDTLLDVCRSLSGHANNGPEKP